MKKGFMLLLLLLVVPSAFARSAHMKLLAVADAEGAEYGSTADLFLEVKPGTGKIYIDSFPLTKIDTQITTRFANEIACDFLERDCSKYDFYYTIRASSSIVGGPSASAAITVITIAVLDNLKLDERSAITGTINSGGFVGPVGGILPKIEAAGQNNLTKVVIPKWSSVNQSNITDYEARYGLKVIPVSTLDDAVYQVTGKRYDHKGTVVVSSSYLDTMNNISLDLCRRTGELATYMPGNISMQNDAYDLYRKGNSSLAQEKYYSAASYCFGANVKFNYLRLVDESPKISAVRKRAAILLNTTDEYRDHIKKKDISTITDLQTFVVVNERLEEAEGYFRKAVDTDENNTNTSTYNLAFGIERLNSAYSWATFFGKPGLKFNINRETLQASCLNKLAEAEERVEYLKEYLPVMPDGVQNDLNTAYSSMRESDFENCLYRASKAKADVDIILNSIGIDEKDIDAVISDRMSIVEQVMAREIQKGIFPIIGYSYYEYADSLKESDKVSALLYLEYALEVSNMDIYFKKEEFSLPMVETRDLVLFLLGGTAGFCSAVLLVNIGSLRKKKKR